MLLILCSWMFIVVVVLFHLHTTTTPLSFHLSGPSSHRVGGREQFIFLLSKTCQIICPPSPPCEVMGCGGVTVKVGQRIMLRLPYISASRTEGPTALCSNPSGIWTAYNAMTSLHKCFLHWGSHCALQWSLQVSGEQIVTPRFAAKQFIIGHY